MSVLKHTDYETYYMIITPILKWTQSSRDMNVEKNIGSRFGHSMQARETGPSVELELFRASHMSWSIRV